MVIITKITIAARLIRDCFSMSSSFFRLAYSAISMSLIFFIFIQLKNNSDHS
jgi:hypothetical protein